jgi:hypothetical protein
MARQYFDRSSHGRHYWRILHGCHFGLLEFFSIGRPSRSTVVLRRTLSRAATRRRTYGVRQGRPFKTCFPRLKPGATVVAKR